MLFRSIDIIVAYDHDIAINSLAKITLNGQEVDNPRVLEGEPNKLIANFNLERGKKYTFHIPANAVAGIGSKTFAPELTINFNTGKINIIDKAQLATALTNANATAEAKALYQLFVDNYGVKQFSGAMGEVAWSTAYSDFIAEQAGAYPAIVGFDYIHLVSSPSSWIDYGDITPIKKVWEAGSIPAFTWHWKIGRASCRERV